MDTTEKINNLAANFPDLKNKSREELLARLAELPQELWEIRNRPGMMEMPSEWPLYVTENNAEETYIRYLLGEDVTEKL